MGGAAGLEKSDHPLAPAPNRCPAPDRLVVAAGAFHRRVAQSTEVPRGRRPPRPGCAPRLPRRSPMTLRSLIRQRFGVKARPSTPRPRARLALEPLEDRLAPAIQLLHGGPGTPLSLQELVSGSTPFVSISETTTGLLRIDLGSQFFDTTSTAEASGLTYEIDGNPGQSNFATLNIRQANNILNLEAT